jgi:cytochrome c biogenesis protein CcmG, thiol:disulfide interchange protein DsbE
VTDPATPPPTAAPVPEPPAAPEPASPAPSAAAERAAAEPAPRPRPTRRIAALVGVALVTTIAIVGFVAIVRPGPAGGSGGIAKGQPVPDIHGTALDGSPIDLASLRGHPVVVNFWASWCGPCQQEMPLLAQKAQEHDGSGLEILGVLSDDTAANGQAFEKTYGATWPSAFDGDGSIKRAYQVIGRPQSYFIDKDGILRSIQVGYLTDADFERQLAMISGGG